MPWFFSKRHCTLLWNVFVSISTCFISAQLWICHLSINRTISWSILLVIMWSRHWLRLWACSKTSSIDNLTWICVATVCSLILWVWLILVLHTIIVFLRLQVVTNVHSTWCSSLYTTIIWTIKAAELWRCSFNSEHVFLLRWIRIITSLLLSKNWIDNWDYASASKIVCSCSKVADIMMIVAACLIDRTFVVCMASAYGAILIVTHLWAWFVLMVPYRWVSMTFFILNTINTCSVFLIIVNVLLIGIEWLIVINDGWIWSLHYLQITTNWWTFFINETTALNYLTAIIYLMVLAGYLVLLWLGRFTVRWPIQPHVIVWKSWWSILVSHLLLQACNHVFLTLIYLIEVIDLFFELHLFIIHPNVFILKLLYLPYSIIKFLFKALASANNFIVFLLH